MREETKTIFYRLLGEEQREEYIYQVDSGNDMEYLKDLLRAELDFINNNEKGIGKFVSLEILKEDLTKYGISIEDLK